MIYIAAHSYFLNSTDINSSREYSIWYCIIKWAWNLYLSGFSKKGTKIKTSKMHNNDNKWLSQKQQNIASKQ